jgi:hypothetical protein
MSFKIIKSNLCAESESAGDPHTIYLYTKYRCTVDWQFLELFFLYLTHFLTLSSDNLATLADCRAFGSMNERCSHRKIQFRTNGRPF